MVRRNLMAAFVTVVILGSFTPPAIAQRVTRRVFVSATDGSGASVTGLAAADFTLSEHGAPREIARVAADVPMRVLLVVDSTSAVSPMITQLRSGPQAFYEGPPQTWK